MSKQIHAIVSDEFYCHDSNSFVVGVIFSVSVNDSVSVSVLFSLIVSFINISMLLVMTIWLLVLQRNGAHQC